MTPEAITDAAIEVLNSAFQADPEAIHALIANRLPCNQELIDHPDVVVDESRAVPAGYLVGPLGLINGILGRLGAPLVAIAWEDPSGDSPGRCRGFCRHTTA